MKKTFASVLRLVMLVGVFVLLPSLNKGPLAQGAPQCVTFSAQEIECCTSGCSKTGVVAKDEVDQETSGTGYDSVLNASYSCGTGNGCGVQCSGDYPQIVMNTNCCIANGLQCASNEVCCGGTCLSNGTCGVCSQDGESCGANSDCCFYGSGSTCVGGTCTASCFVDGSACLLDDDCCSGYCPDGYCTEPCFTGC